ncbi:MAG: hypothetical protein NT131_00500 [Methanomassiliicoccales archaeon]|nr:hypothetical protein [Methanomassiliicoccales archaeon]
MQVGKTDSDIVTLVNLLLCLVIVSVGLIGYHRSKHTLPLMMAIIFALFGFSHLLVLFGMSDNLGPSVFVVRVVAYGLVIYLLYRYVRVLDIF